MNYFWPDLNYIDLILAVPVLLGAVIGYRKGFIIEIASLIALVLGVYGAMEFSFYISDLLKSKLDWSAELVHFLSLAITFLIIVLIVHLIARAIQGIIKMAALGLVNRITGSIFGALKYFLVLSILVYLFERANARYPFAEKEKLEQSMIYPWTAGVVPVVYPVVEEYMEEED